MKSKQKVNSNRRHRCMITKLKIWNELLDLRSLTRKRPHKASEEEGIERKAKETNKISRPRELLKESFRGKERRRRKIIWRSQQIKPIKEERNLTIMLHNLLLRRHSIQLRLILLLHRRLWRRKERKENWHLLHRMNQPPRRNDRSNTMKKKPHKGNKRSNHLV